MTKDAHETTEVRPIIRYKKGKEMYLADTLSRHYLEAEEGATAAEVSQVRSKFEQELENDEGVHEINQLLAEETRVNKYRVETDLDETLQTVKTMISRYPLPDDKSRLPPATVPYYHLTDELATQDGLIFR